MESVKFKISDIEQKVRIVLLDTYEDNYRYAPTEIFHAIRDAVRMTRNIRPESKYVDGLLVDKMIVNGDNSYDFVVPESFPADVFGVTSMTIDQYRDVEINMDQRWMEAIAYYVLHQMYMKDDADTVNATLSQTYYTKFTEAVKS